MIRYSFLGEPKVIEVEVNFPVFLRFNKEIFRFQIPKVDIGRVEVVNNNDDVC